VGRNPSKSNSLERQYFGLIPQEACAKFDDLARNGIEVLVLLFTDILEQLSQSLNKATLLLATVLVCFAELQKDLVICERDGRGQRVGEGGEGALLLAAHLWSRGD